MTLENVALALQTSGLGTIGTTINIRMSPADVETGILLVAFGGLREAELIGLRNLKFQVVVRGKKYADTMSLAEGVMNALTIRQKAVGTAWFYDVTPRDEPTPFGIDASGLHTVLFNVDAIWRQL